MSFSREEGERLAEPFVPPSTEEGWAERNGGKHGGDVPDDTLTRGQAWCLYLSHFLSMWNSRTYEYGAILFIQAAFPGNLLPSSINGIAETVCVLVSSSALGRWVDRAPTRLRPLLLTIFANRITLVVCCILWLFLLNTPRDTLKKVMFAMILGLGMVEKASRMTNILSMERDWVPTLANADGADYGLTHMNTIMRRIDIVCKFLAPLAISGVVALAKPAPAAVAIAGVSTVSLALECWTVLRVWKNNSRLRAAKRGRYSANGSLELDPWHGRADLRANPYDVGILQLVLAKGEKLLEDARSIIRAHVDGLAYYFSTTVWLPSICVAVLHASVLAWSGTLITWLLNANFSLAEVTAAKGVGSFFEIGSTFVFPWAVSVFSAGARSRASASTASYQMIARRGADDEDEADVEDEDEIHHREEPSKLRSAAGEETQFLGSRSLHVGVVKAAHWAIISLVVCLIPTLIFLYPIHMSVKDLPTDPTLPDDPPPPSPLAELTFFAVMFFAFLSFSFLGRWTFDLAVTQLTQMLIPAAHRSSFGGTEQAIVSCVSLLHWVSAAIWHEQSDFIWLALGSFCAVAAATVAFAWWSRGWVRGAERR